MEKFWTYIGIIASIMTVLGIPGILYWMKEDEKTTIENKKDMPDSDTKRRIPWL